MKTQLHQLHAQFSHRLVVRRHAARSLLLMLLSFAGSITLTRLFLELTGYPQLGSGTYHIAHVLWGGLLLFIAALLPLVYANVWINTWAALLAGAGVGLFIDEVGKFITASNDYFFPLAAPIVYAFFLLTVMLYLQVRRTSPSTWRSELYHILDDLQEILDNDLDRVEQADLVKRLQATRTHLDQPALARLADDLVALLQDPSLPLLAPRPTLVEKLLAQARVLEQRWVTRPRLESLLAGGLLALGLMALYNMLRALPLGEAASLERIIRELMIQGQIQSQRGLNWFAARLALESATGLLLITAAGLLIAGKDQLATRLGYLGLLLALTTVNLLVFYFDQFSTIITAIIQFDLLLVLNYYRRRFLEIPKIHSP